MNPTLNTLLRHGVINMRYCEQLAIRERLEELVKGHLGRCEAMEVVVEEFCCSYEKVRKIIYTKTQNVS